MRAGRVVGLVVVLLSGLWAGLSGSSFGSTAHVSRRSGGGCHRGRRLDWHYVLMSRAAEPWSRTRVRPATGD